MTTNVLCFVLVDSSVSKYNHRGRVMQLNVGVALKKIFQSLRSRLLFPYPGLFSGHAAMFLFILYLEKGASCAPVAGLQIMELLFFPGWNVATLMVVGSSLKGG